RLKRVVARRLLAGQIKDVLRSGQQDKIKTLLLHPLTQPSDPPLIFGLWKHRFRALRHRLQDLLKTRIGTGHRVICPLLQEPERNCTLLPRLCNSWRAREGHAFCRCMMNGRWTGARHDSRRLVAFVRPAAACDDTSRQNGGTKLACCTNWRVKY